MTSKQQLQCYITLYGPYNNTAQEIHALMFVYILREAQTYSKIFLLHHLKHI